MMNWEETIKLLREKPEYSDILFNSYLNDDPDGNVERFRNSEEFIETLSLIRSKFPTVKTILEIGSGTGMSAIAFSLAGYSVTATDPDPSDIVGCEAIQKLKTIYHLPNLEIVPAPGEKLPFEDESFDLVYVRQTLHHAEDLSRFLKEISRVLCKGGGLMAIREHVVFSKNDKNKFLATHPLQSWYGGENAYKPEEYTKAIKDSGLFLDNTYKYFESVINYFPMAEKDVELLEKNHISRLDAACFSKFGPAGRIKLIQLLYRKTNEWRFGPALDERRIPGRMYSFIAHK